MTLRLELIFFFMLQLGGISGQIKHLYKRVGESIALHCDVDKSSNQCSDVSWLYNSPVDANTNTLNKGNTINQSSARASRMSLSSNCSLLIRNIHDEDAGRYTCRIEGRDAIKHLNILNISSSPSGVNVKVDLTCSLKSLDEPNGCEQNSIIWVDETGSQLSGEGQTNCVSVLTVTHQSGNKRFTCKIVRDKEVKIDAVYVPTGISEQTKHLYHRVGDDVLLPCSVKTSSSSCSIVNWQYRKDTSATFIKEVQNGKLVDQSSVRASRLNVDSSCSLFIRNITDEDAGRYDCFLGNFNSTDASVFLNVLSISKDPPEVHPGANGRVTLQCSLKRSDKTIQCKENSIIWLDETGSQLSGKGVGFEFRGQTNCVSVLTVNHQSGNNRRFTCQFVEDHRVKIDAVYDLGYSESPQSNTLFIIGAVAGVVLVLLVVFAVLLFKSRRTKAKDQKRGTNFHKTTQHISEQKVDLEIDPESDLTYVAVNHSKSKASSKITMEEERGEVTYSSIKRK